MLTQTQIQTLHAAAMADPTALAFISFGNDAGLQGWFNTPDPTYYVWRSNTPTQEIYNAITWAALTPTDTPDGTQLWLNRSMACQGKQFNLQTILRFDNIRSDMVKIRDGLQDALTGLPSGTGGAVVGAGWSTTRTTMQRTTTRAEKILATGTGTTTTPASLGWEGYIGVMDASTIREG